MLPRFPPAFLPDGTLVLQLLQMILQLIQAQLLSEHGVCLSDTSVSGVVVQAGTAEIRIQPLADMQIPPAAATYQPAA